MNSIFFGWCKTLSGYYAELTSDEKEKSIRSKVILDFHRVMDAMKKTYLNNEDIILIEKMKQYFSGENFLPEKVDALIEEMNADFKYDTVDLYERASSVIEDKGKTLGIDALTNELVDEINAMELLKNRGKWNN